MGDPRAAKQNASVVVAWRVRKLPVSFGPAGLQFWDMARFLRVQGSRLLPCDSLVT